MASALYLSPEELAERLSVPLETVYTWNKTGYAPPRSRFGLHVRYAIKDVEAWEKARRVALLEVNDGTPA